MINANMNGTRMHIQSMSTTLRNENRIRITDLKGRPGLRHKQIRAILELQPSTVLEALLIPGVARKTTGFLLEMGLIADPHNVQERCLFDVICELDTDVRKTLLNRVTKYLCRVE